MNQSAFLAIVGCANAGKSSLLNALLGEKVAIVSEKPQTTRTRIMGALTEGTRQLVFTDTPGMHRPRSKLGAHMVRAVQGSMDGVDACLFVTTAQGSGLRPEEETLLASLQKRGCLVLLVINKIDLLPHKGSLFARAQQLSECYDFAEVLPLSALTGENLDALRRALWRLFENPALALPEGFFFPEDTLTDQPERVLAAELLREQLLRTLQQEIPHGVAVAVERMRERESAGDLIDIEAVIFCERESHKGIIIGKRGEMLKRVSIKARVEMEALLGCRVNLQCWVKVREDWRNREGQIRALGLES